MKVIITGATGFIGSNLVKVMMSEGYQLVAVSRNKEKARKKLPEGIQVIGWSGDELVPALKSSDAVINLAGESISSFPWSKKKKRAIMNSRLLAAQRLHQALSSLKSWPGVFIQASAIGYYGNQRDKECSELFPAGKGFLAEVCRRWESQVQQLHRLTRRIITIRIGVVLGRDDGIFPELLKQTKRHLGGRLGRGNQWISWIHVYDLAYSILYLLNDERAKGTFNLVAPQPVRQKELSRMMAKYSGVSFQMHAPALMIRLLLGEFGKELLLNGQKVSSGKMIRQGFIYKYDTVDKALDELFDPLT